jgi:hypothetical protein
MPPTIYATQNLAVVRGDTFNRSYQIKLNNEPRDITGWIIYFTIKKQISDLDSEALLQKILPISDSANGIFNVSLTTDETWKIASTGKSDTPYVYDIQCDTGSDPTSPDFERMTKIMGNFYCIEGVTHATNAE